MRLSPAALDECVQILANARSLVVSTGAGMSKESGIPTFRDAPNALWANYDPMQLASPEGFRTDPALVWRWYEDRRAMIAKAKPNPGHIAIAKLEPQFGRFTLVTQNIDNLHRKAGSSDPVEIHGNIFRYKCFDNHHVADTLADDVHVPPRCHCGSLMRPDVVWFGEMLPAAAVDRAYGALGMCDVIVVIGTSGQVVPAAGFPRVAREAGAAVIEINPETTPNTNIADVFLQGPAGEILPQVVDKLDAVKSKGQRS